MPTKEKHNELDPDDLFNACQQVLLALAEFQAVVKCDKIDDELSGYTASKSVALAKLNRCATITVRMARKITGDTAELNNCLSNYCDRIDRLVAISSYSCGELEGYITNEEYFNSKHSEEVRSIIIEAVEAVTMMREFAVWELEGRTKKDALESVMQRQRKFYDPLHLERNALAYLEEAEKTGKRVTALELGEYLGCKKTRAAELAAWKDYSAKRKRTRKAKITARGDMKRYADGIPTLSARKSERIKSDRMRQTVQADNGDGE